MLMICGTLTHLCICTLYDFPKNVHYQVSCYRDGGENADGAEPAIGRAKQHLSESTDTKTECRDAYPRISDSRRGRQADRRRQAGAPWSPGCDADLVAFRHGLRAVEIADLEWSQVEWGRNPALHVRRAKNGKPAVPPIRGDELRMLRELQRNTTVPLSSRQNAAARLPLTPSTAS